MRTPSGPQPGPPQLKWADRRVIGTSYLGSSPAGGNITQPGGFASNPRRYLNDGNADDFDIRTPEGLAKFQTLMLQRAHAVVDNLRRLNAQGVITWDLEGEEFPQSTTYVCSPDQVALEAPEMESVITAKNSPYAGLKLDDAYFKTITGRWISRRGLYPAATVHQGRKWNSATGCSLRQCC